MNEKKQEGFDDEQIDHFVKRIKQLDAEIKLLQEDRKDLFDSLKDRVKPAVLREAVRIAKKRAKLGDDVVQLDRLVDLLDGEV